MSDATARPPPTCMRILIVDDHAVVREGLKRMLEASEPSWRIEEAANAFEALDRVRTQGFDVAIVDISMPGMSGLDFLKRVRASQLSLRVLMLSMFAEEQYAVRAFKSGANGYVTKDESLAQSLALGLGNASGELPHESLSNRELDILRRLACGDRPTDIALALHISVKTVSTHKARILARLQLANAAALVRYAVEHHLVPEAPDSGRESRGSGWQKLQDDAPTSRDPAP